MLKKLVKYGNSNALVFDKAILELLNIKEGSLVKIETDGKRLIITPHTERKEEVISKTADLGDSLSQAMISRALNTNKNLSETQKDAVLDEWQGLMDKYKKIMQKPRPNEYREKLVNLYERHKDTLNSPDYKRELQEIVDQYFSTEERAILQRFKDIERAYFPSVVKEDTSADAQKGIAAMQAIQEKYADTATKLKNLVNNEDYLHEQQLLTEAYTILKNAELYMQGLQALRYKYVPEALIMDQEIQDVLKKE